LKLIDEYRKEKRRRDLSDSDDDDDPFHTKSIGFSPSRNNRLNMTPTSSLRANSITGKSRASATKGGAAAPAGGQTGGKNAN